MRSRIASVLALCLLLPAAVLAQEASLAYSPLTPEARLAYGQERDTTGAPLIELQSGWFQSDKFSYGEGESQRVFSFWGTLTPEMKSALDRHPEALDTAKEANTYATVGVIGAGTLAALAVLSAFDTSDDADSIEDFNEASSSTLGRTFRYSLGILAIGAVTGALARSRVREGVREFNDRQRAGPSPRPGPVSPPAADAEAGRGIGAAEESVGEASSSGLPTPARPARLESWYTYWGLGWANPGYPGELDPIIEDLRDTPEVSSLALNLDLLGFYFPLGGDKTIVGGVINGSAERFEVEGESFQINQFLYAASVMHFFDEYIGRGFFARGDVGLARIVVDSSFGGLEASESGFGFLLGGGYAFQITRGTRLLLNANYARRSVEGESYSALSFGIGGLF